jgi:uncharacterized OB-fold protein
VHVDGGPRNRGDVVSDQVPRRFEPPVTEVTAPFWEATRRRVLLVQWCTDCDKPIFFPREVCPGCLGTRLDWREASGNGTVHAVSVQHLPSMPLPAYTERPYAVALVELTEGVRMMSNLVGCAPEDVTVGMPVSVTWEEMTDGRHLPQFTPRSKWAPR